MAQDVLVTFEGAVGEVALRPSDCGGKFDIWIDGTLIWSRKAGGFPELVRQRIDDVIAPDQSLGHREVTAQSCASRFWLVNPVVLGIGTQ